jgi:hypothetical protein
MNDWLFLSKEGKDEYINMFASGSRGEIVNLDDFDYNSSSNTIVLRGILKKKIMQRCWLNGRDFYFMDTGYMGNLPGRNNPHGWKYFHRIVKNELQKSIIEHRPADRWEALVKGDGRLRWPGWKKNGNKILLIISNPKSCHYFGYDMPQWLETTISAIKKHTDMEIIIRHKGSRPERNQYSIYDILDTGIFATVAFNSIAAMESIAYGVPAFTTVSCAATPLSLTDLSKITSPWYPDPSQVAQHCHSLAYGQFTQKEIADGIAWKLLNK